MKIILRDEIKGLGGRGDVVNVKPGYARNFLLPHGLALPATDGNVRQVEVERRRFVLRDEKALEAAQIRAEKFEGVSVTIPKKVADDQTLFGSVTASDIAEKLAEAGLSVERKQIMLDEPIKMLGIYDVPVALHAKVRPAVKVWVVKE